VATKKDKRPTVQESSACSNAERMAAAIAKTPEQAFAFKMVFGDPSRDGHGQTRTIEVAANKHFNAVVRAYRSCNAPAPSLLFSEYEERSITQGMYDEVFAAGYDLLGDTNTDEEERVRRVETLGETWEMLLECPQIDVEALSYYVLWCCQQGDSDLQFSRTRVPDLFGRDGIRLQCGYGLLGQ